MKELDDKTEKSEAIRGHFLPLIGRRLSHFDTAQLRIEDGKWHDWFDLPIRLFFGSSGMVSVAWSHFDKLWLSNDHSVNFLLGDSKVRWRTNNNPLLRPVLDKTLELVMLGRGGLVIGDQDVEIWTRLALKFDTGWLEIYNGLDKNSFTFHDKLPEGNFEKCC